MNTDSTGAGESERAQDILVALREDFGDRFEVDRLLGGGMSTVWLATRRSTNERVAIKVMRRELAQSLGVQRFLREMRIAAEIRSPNLVPLDEAGELRGLPYYVMPFIPGESLRERLTRERQLTVLEAVRLTRELAKALEVLHAHGVVHRDIKPDNVLVASDGRVLLADYGIARAITVSANEAVTSTGIVVGTPVYMSPEQGSGDTVDLRTDFYSLGCSLYEMLAGVPPFQGVTSQAVIARHLTESPPSLQAVRPDVSDSVQRFVERALAKIPANRFESAAAFRAALEAVDVAGPATGGPAARRRARNRAVSIGALVAVVLATGVYKYVNYTGPLDSNRVVVFPFRTSAAQDSGSGEKLALLIGSALERTEATHWLDGWSLLDSAQQQRQTNVSNQRLESLARREHARFYLGGSVVREKDSVRIAVELHDLESRDVAREFAAGPPTARLDSLTLAAVVRLLPRVAGLGRLVDVSDLTGRDPAAISSWLNAEREYRASKMETALSFAAVALAADSTLAPAALRAAWSAHWLSLPDTALVLARLAMRHPQALSKRQRAFTIAFERFLAGRANEAIAALRPVLAANADWAEAYMLLGEIQLHLIPTVGIDSLAVRAIPAPREWPLEEFAEQAFTRAHELDPQFFAPLEHLEEIAARRGDIPAAIRWGNSLLAITNDTTIERRIDLTRRCLQNGADRINWTVESRSQVNLYSVGTALLGARAVNARRCAQGAFRAILASDTTIGGLDWGTLVALDGMLVAQNQDASALRMIDSAVARQMLPVLYVLNVVAGSGGEQHASEFIAQIQQPFEARGTNSLWLLTLWSARNGDAKALDQIRVVLEARATSGTRLDSLVARIAGAYAALAAPDTALALRLFSALESTADGRAVDNELWEALAPERLRYAQLLLARGDAVSAHRVASLIDQPAVIINQLFLRQSLELRKQAARALGDSALVRRADARLASLRATGGN